MRTEYFYMKKLLLIIGIVFINHQIFAQKIVVKDMETTFPISNVKVSNEQEKKLYHTDSKGIVDIKDFKKSDSIIFVKPNYEKYKTTKRDILRNKNVVELIKKYQKLDNVILSISRTKNKANKIAEQVRIIDRIETMKIMPSTSADLLNVSGGLIVQKTQGGAGSPIIRGLEANRILLVVDGIRLNNAISRSGHLHHSITVNPLILERTEIIYGPSSIYGSDALGGVINFYSKTPKINSSKKIGGSISAKYATVNTEKSIHASAEISFKKAASLFAFSYADFGNIKMGAKRYHHYNHWGIVDEYSENSDTYYSDTPTKNTNKLIQPNTSFKQKDFFNKTLIEFSENIKLNINTQLNFNSKIDRFDKLTQRKKGKLKYAEWYYGPTKRLLISPQLSLKFDSKFLKEAKVIFAFQDFKESRIKRKFNSLNRSFQKEHVSVSSFNLDLNTNFGKDKTLSYGLEATHNIIESNAYSENLMVDANSIVGQTPGDIVPTRYPDGGSIYSSFAGYTNYRMNLNRRNTFNFGVRFTQTYMNVEWIDDTFIKLPFKKNKLANYAFTGNLSYIYKPENWKHSFLLSSGFRSPNVDDIGKVREKKGKVMVPNIYLKPEYAYNAEYGITRFLNHKKFSISADIYYSYLMNYIARDKFEIIENVSQIYYDGEMLDTYANINKGDAYIYGGSLILDGKISRKFKLEGGVFYTKGKMFKEKRPLPSITPFFGSSKLTYRINHFETSLLYKFMLRKPIEEYDIIGGMDNIEDSPYNSVTKSYEGFPEWHTLNWYATYHFNSKLMINLAIENIFDVHYREFASSISAPGRNLKIQLTSKF